MCKLEFFRQWAISICASGIIATIFSMIAPKGSMDKIIKLMLSVFIFTSMLTPFLDGGSIAFESMFSLPEATVSAEELRAQANEITLSAAKNSVEQAIGDFLEERGCTVYQVEAALHVDEENYAVLDGATLYLSGKDMAQAEALKESAEQEFQMPIQIAELGE